MPDSIEEKIAALRRLDRASLCQLWKELFDQPPLFKLRRALLISILAYRIQEQSFGTLRSETRRRLRQIARALEMNPNAGIPSVAGIKPGSRLVRQWHGQTHVVNVEERGFEYKGCHYESLSEIARLITGTRWSGPLFFGLKAKVASKSRMAR